MQQERCLYLKSINKGNTIESRQLKRSRPEILSGKLENYFLRRRGQLEYHQE